MGATNGGAQGVRIPRAISSYYIPSSPPPPSPTPRAFSLLPTLSNLDTHPLTPNLSVSETIGGTRGQPSPEIDLQQDSVASWLPAGRQLVTLLVVADHARAARVAAPSGLLPRGRSLSPTLERLHTNQTTSKPSPIMSHHACPPQVEGPACGGLASQSRRQGPILIRRLLRDQHDAVAKRDVAGTCVGWHGYLDW